MKKSACGIAFLLLLICGFFCSCKKDEREDKQRERIGAYIKSFIEEYKKNNGGKELSVDEYDGVYVILIAIDSSAQSRELIRPNDVVEFDYLAQSLGGAVFAAGDSTLAAQNNLMPTPIGEVQVGTGGLISGLDRGLQRMALGDQGLILFPFTLGYGEEYMGVVGSESALIFQVLITKVNGVSF